MEISGKVVVVTGGGKGIGRALAIRFAAEKAKAVIVADRDEASAKSVAAEINGLGLACDVGREADIQALIKRVLDDHGQIDLFCSNAGIGSGGGIEMPDAQWNHVWNVNVMSHVWAARALMPSMLEKGSGRFMITASAAGLLAMIGDAPYTVTKHAAVSLAEWLSITYGDRGLAFHALCPQFVNTDLLHGALGVAGGKTIAAAGPVIEPDAVAESVMVGLREEKFLILPHAEVATFVTRRAADRDRWLASMRKLKALK